MGKVSIGRIVLWSPGPARKPLPAIVVEVLHGERVDLEVFGVLPDRLDKIQPEVQHGAGADGFPLSGCWAWPPRVGEGS